MAGPNSASQRRLVLSRWYALGGIASVAAPVGVAYFKAVAGVVTTSGNPSKKTFTSKKTGSITASATLANRIVFKRFLTGAVTMSGRVQKSTRRLLASASAFSGVVNKKTSRLLTGTLTTVGNPFKKTFRKLVASIVLSATLQDRNKVRSIQAGSITASSIVTTVATSPPPVEQTSYFMRRRLFGRI